MTLKESLLGQDFKSLPIEEQWALFVGIPLVTVSSFLIGVSLPANSVIPDAAQLPLSLVLLSGVGVMIGASEAVEDDDKEQSETSSDEQTDD